MTNLLGPQLLFLGIFFLLPGLIYLIVYKKRTRKYNKETLATIISCEDYIKKVNDDTRIYSTRRFYGLTFEFVVNNKRYKVRHEISKKNIPPVGEQVKIYYNPKNPKDIDITITGFRKVLHIASYGLTFTGLGFALTGCLLILLTK